RARRPAGRLQARRLLALHGHAQRRPAAQLALGFGRGAVGRGAVRHDRGPGVSTLDRQQDWRNRRVLVTGATGMVGSWLVKALADAGAYTVAFVLDPDPQSELYRSRDIEHVSVACGALEDFRSVERAIVLHEVDTVFHLGAQTIVGVAHDAPLITFEAN